MKIVKKHVTGPQGVRGRNSDNTRLRQVLVGAAVSLEDGLAKTYAWIEKQVAAQLEAAGARAAPQTPVSDVPYISVVATSRNDDHGGNMLRRMQIFVNAWIEQCRRHDLASELLLVEWNPPADVSPCPRCCSGRPTRDPARFGSSPFPRRFTAATVTRNRFPSSR